MSLSNVTTEASTTTWNIDPSHSAAGFTVRHMVIAKVHGKFTRFSGVLKSGWRFQGGRSSNRRGTPAAAQAAAA